MSPLKLLGLVGILHNWPGLQKMWYLALDKLIFRGKLCTTGARPLSRVSWLTTWCGGGVSSEVRVPQKEAWPRLESLGRIRTQTQVSGVTRSRPWRCSNALGGWGMGEEREAQRLTELSPLSRHNMGSANSSNEWAAGVFFLRLLEQCWSELKTRKEAPFTLLPLANLP